MSLLKPYYESGGITIYNGDCNDLLPTLPRFDLLLTDPPYGIDAANMGLGSGNTSKPKSKRFVKSDWDKQTPVLERCLGAADTHCVWGGNYFTDQLPATNHWLVWHKKNDGRSFSECELAWTTFGKQTRHLSHGWSGEKKLHPTQKPLSVMRWCLSFSKDVQTVLDPFMGSGTTLLACKLEGKRAVGIELDEKYCEIAANRLAQKLMFTETEVV